MKQEGQLRPGKDWAKKVKQVAAQALTIRFNSCCAFDIALHLLSKLYCHLVSNIALSRALAPLSCPSSPLSPNSPFPTLPAMSATAAAAAAGGSPPTTPLAAEEEVAVNGRHPQGVKPEGNAFMDSLSGIRPVRDTGLGPHFSKFSDSQLLEFLTYLDAPSLAQLSQTSQAMYAFSSHDDVWRTLTLKSFGASFTFAKSWRSTFIKRAYGKHVPEASLCLRGMYSDLLFKAWFCASAEIEKRWLEHDNIERRSAKSFTVADFQREFDRPNKPVIITDCTTQWPAFGKWTPSFFASQPELQHVQMEAGGFQFGLADYFSFSESVAGRDDHH